MPAGETLYTLYFSNYMKPCIGNILSSVNSFKKYIKLYTNALKDGTKSYSVDEVYSVFIKGSFCYVWLTVCQ